MTPQPNPAPPRIRLTEDYLDLEVGMAYPAGTELVRLQSGQYGREGTRLGQECVAYLGLIKHYVEVTHPADQ